METADEEVRRAACNLTGEFETMTRLNKQSDGSTGFDTVGPMPHAPLGAEH